MVCFRVEDFRNRHMTIMTNKIIDASNRMRTCCKSFKADRGPPTLACRFGVKGNFVRHSNHFLPKMCEQPSELGLLSCFKCCACKSLVEAFPHVQMHLTVLHRTQRACGNPRTVPQLQLNSMVSQVP